LDEVLARRAHERGVEVRERSRVTAIEGGLLGGFRVRVRAASGGFSLQARAVIAAHGRRSSLDRCLKRPFLGRRHPFVALKNHFYGPPLRHGIELHGFRGGYCGIAEIENGAANVCLLARESVFRGAGVAPFLAWMRRQNPRLQEWFSRAEPLHGTWLSIAQVPFIRKGPVSGDLLMAGDAGALIAPLTGDGIAMALRSGRLAASSVEELLQGRLAADQLARRYAARWRRQFTARLLLARGLQSLMLRPRLLSAALRVTTGIPPLTSFLVAHTRGS